MSDTKWDFIMDKVMEDKERQHWGRRDYCDRDCSEHNESCPYYDAEEESWDYEECFNDKGWD